jgi:hypothetical protein
MNNIITVTAIREHDVYYTFVLTDEELAAVGEELGYTAEDMTDPWLPLADRTVIFDHLLESHDYDEEIGEVDEKITDVIVEEN